MRVGRRDREPFAPRTPEVLPLDERLELANVVLSSEIEESSPVSLRRVIVLIIELVAT